MEMKGTLKSLIYRHNSLQLKVPEGGREDPEAVTSRELCSQRW